MSEAKHTPTERAMRAAVNMEVHAACSTATRAKAEDLDKSFPAYDEMLAAMTRLADLFEHVLATPGYGQDENSREEASSHLTAARTAISRAGAPVAWAAPTCLASVRAGGIGQIDGTPKQGDVTLFASEEKGP